MLLKILSVKIAQQKLVELRFYQYHVLVLVMLF